MTRTVSIRVINATGSWDSTAELESNLLLSLLPMFSREIGTARAEVELVRTTTEDRFLRYLFNDDVDIVHIISHGNGTKLQIGHKDSGASLGYKAVTQYARDSNRQLDALVIGAACELGSKQWVKSFLGVGAAAFIAPRASVLVRDLAVFESAFYSAYLARIGVNKTPVQRAFDAYRLARASQRSLSPGGGSARFYWHSEHKVEGRILLDPVKVR